MNKFELILDLFILMVAKVHAQNEHSSENHIRRNSTYIEFGGNAAGTVSVNYERKIIPSNRLGCSIGFGYLPTGNGHYNYSIPIEFKYLFGKFKHYVEVGLGATYYTYYNTNVFSNSTLFFTRVGYRYSCNSGLIIRIGFTPVIDPERNIFSNRFAINPFGGISIGYTF